MNTGIYKIEHKTSGKVYIGSAVDFRARECKHWLDLRKGMHRNKHLQNAYDRYGAEAFEFKRLIICSRKNLLMYEQLCLDKFDAVKRGYNIAFVAGSPMLGRVVSDETKEKISRSNKGKNLGKKHSEESLRKISAASKGNQHMLGKPRSEETVDKISRSLIGNKRSVGRTDWVGRKHSEESKEKMRLAKLGIKLSAEHRAKLSTAQQARVKREKSEACV
jgi:group I intron endonuclease